MKKKVIAITITLLVATAGALTLVQCDHSNMARVTIHIQNELHATNNDSIIDKLLKLISSNAYATFPPPWTEEHSGADGYLTLFVSGSDIQTVEIDIPPTSTTFTTEVPAGAQRSFILKFYNDSQGSFTWGGGKTITLSPGETDITITMIPMTEITSHDGLIGSPIQIYWRQFYESLSYSNDYSTIISGFNIYRANPSDGPNGPYTKIGFANGYNAENYSDNSINATSEPYYYKVSVVTLSGKEGLLSDFYPAAGS